MPNARTRTEAHVGEWKVSITAPTREAIAAELARVIAKAAGPVHGEPVPWEAVAVEARDVPTLLVDFANDLIGRGEAASVAYGELADTTIAERPEGGATLTARVRGRPVRTWRSALKAATYHGLALSRHGAGWRATILFDV